MSGSQFDRYKRCTKCNKPFKNYIETDRCPWCKSKKYVIDLLKKEKNENNKTEC